MFLLGLSGLFSASEMALFSLSRIQLKRIGDRHPHRHGLVVSLLDRPRRTLITILIGNTLVNVAASAVATSLSIHLFGEVGIGIAVGTMTFLILIFGEINPKTVALRNAEGLSVIVAPFIEFFAYLILPIRRLTRAITDFLLDLLVGESYIAEPFISSHELKTLVSIGEREGILDQDERDMIHAVFEFGETRANEIMTPRVEITACPMEASSGEVKKILEKVHRTKVPVYEKSLDHIVGVLATKDFLLSREENWRKLVRSAYFIPESKKIGELLSEFQRSQESLAIVVDEFGGTAGLVTREDILEEVVGEIRDEYDIEEDPFHQIETNALRVNGRVSLKDLKEKFGMSYEGEEAPSVAGYLLSKLGHIPKVGETFRDGALHFTVEEVRRNQIRRLIVRKES